ncbi:hypothetical protein HYW76_02030 [Candidatus Pacearchaeota archaeon]|nr:hypothetical protein [Candidatus Pacearchaeota archaeon]
MKPKSSNFTGRWDIFNMSNWGEDYFNEEEQAYIKINKNNSGEFKFGYVSAEIDGRITKEDREDVLEFTFEGNDELEPVQGRGWVKLKENNLSIIEGEIFFHMGDSSKFSAKKVRDNID